MYWYVLVFTGMYWYVPLYIPHDTSTYLYIPDHTGINMFVLLFNRLIVWHRAAIPPPAADHASREKGDLIPCPEDEPDEELFYTRPDAAEKVLHVEQAKRSTETRRRRKTCASGESSK